MKGNGLWLTAPRSDRKFAARLTDWQSFVAGDPRAAQATGPDQTYPSSCGG